MQKKDVRDMSGTELKREYIRAIFDGSPYVEGSGLRAELSKGLMRLSITNLSQLTTVINFKRGT